MKTRVFGFCSVLGILLFACFSPRTEAAFDPESFLIKLDALTNIIDTIYHKSWSAEFETAFGVTLAQVNLMATLYNKNISNYLIEEFLDMLEEMIDLSITIRLKTINDIYPMNFENTMLSNLINPFLWIKPISWTRITSRPEFKFNRLLNPSQTIKLINKGNPNIRERNKCLIKIFDSTILGKCNIPANCIAMLTKEDNTTIGFPLLYRLQIVQIAEKLGCKVKTVSLSSLIPVYCARIYQDFIQFEALNFPDVVRNLVLQQVALCGMEGYSEFVELFYESEIIDWCYSYGCHGHMAGFATACLALFMRENVENGHKDFDNV